MPESAQSAPTETATPGVVNYDNIYNYLTGMGTGREASYDVGMPGLLDYGRLRLIYRFVGYAKRMVDLPVNDALSKGINIAIDGRSNDALTPEWRSESRRLRIPEKMKALVKTARWAGAGYMVKVTDDGTSPDKPLDPKRVGKLLRLDVFDPHECKPDYMSLAVGGAAFLETDKYRLYLPTRTRDALKGLPSDWARAFAGEIPIHASRIVKVLGEDLTREERATLGIEGESLIQAFWRELTQAVGITNAAALLANELKQDVVSIEGLEAIASSDQADAFDDRMRQIKTGKALTNLILLGRGETFEQRNMNVSGFRELVDCLNDALVAVSGIPGPIFFAKGSTGLSGAAGVESETYLSLLGSLWTDKIGPAYEEVYDLVRAQTKGPYAGRSTKDAYTLTSNPLREESPKDRASRGLIFVQTLAIAAGARAISPEYMAEAFKAPGGFTFDLPAYDPEKWPVAPLPDPNAPGGPPPPGAIGNESPNKEGKNAPGQLPPDPTKATTPDVNPGAQGVDPRGSGQNTGTNIQGDAWDTILDLIASDPALRARLAEKGLG